MRINGHNREYKILRSLKSDLYPELRGAVYAGLGGYSAHCYTSVPCIHKANHCKRVPPCPCDYEEKYLDPTPTSRFLFTGRRYLRLRRADFWDFVVQISTTMPGYEDSVYLAKLAEQAERYEGSSRSTYALCGIAKLTIG